MRLFVTILSCCIFQGGFAAAADHHCAQNVSTELAKLKLGPEKVVKITYVGITGGCCDRLKSYEAWVKVKQCTGSVVVKMSLECDVEETYARRGCDIDSLK
jgi:hypothetical protein